MSTQGEVQTIMPAARPTPTELARIVETFDEEDWFEFLNQMDLVYRRRRQREAEAGHEAERPSGGDRKAMADWVATQHLLVDRTIREIHYLPTDSPPNEIRLIEVNDRLSGPDAERVEAMEFGLDSEGGPFRLFVVNVNSEEFEAIQAGRLGLPPGWKFDREGTTYMRRRHV